MLMHSRRHRPVGARIALLCLLPIAAAVAACNNGGPGGGQTDALATLTAAAPPVEASPVATQPSAAAPLSTPDLGIPTPLIETGPGTPLDAVVAATAARETQRASDATAEIPEAGTMIANTTPLATFTPDPGSEPDGSLLWVRAGHFYEADASGGKPQSVGSGMPPVWAPPDDPGRAWASPDGKWIAFFAGANADLWVMRPDGKDAHAVSGPNLPTGEHQVNIQGVGETTVRMLPGRDFTLVLTPGEDAPVSVLVDDNSRHIRGEGRLRVVHAAEAVKDKTLVVQVNGGGMLQEQIGFGQATGGYSVPAGPLSIQFSDTAGNSVANLTGLNLGEFQLMTVFLYGRDQLKGVEAQYEPGQPAAGASRIRIFNTTEGPLSATVDGSIVLAQALAPGTLGTYASVPGEASSDQRSDLEYSIYGLRAGEDPVQWSPDSRHVAFIGAPDGHEELFVADPGGKAGDVNRVTSSSEREINPRWSPDGKSVGWSGLDESVTAFTLNVLRGSGPAQQVDLSPILQDLGEPPGTSVKLPEPVGWADDHTIFVYPVVGNAVGIWTFDLDRGTSRRVTDLAIADPDWAPESQMWAFGLQGDLGVIDTLGLDGRPNQIVASDGWAPLWAPDGRRLSWVEGAKMSLTGWRLHVVNADGSGDRAVSDDVPVMQESPPVPGPKAKRYWLDGGRLLAFTVVGRDYGAAERQGGFRGEAGNDIENLWIVPADGSKPRRRATDFTRVFYLKDIAERPGGDALGMVGFSYLDRSQQLWAVRTDGGSPVHVDAGVRWFHWLN